MGSRESFLLENDFNICYTVNFPKKHPDFGGLESANPIKNSIQQVETPLGMMLEKREINISK